MPRPLPSLRLLALSAFFSANLSGLLTAAEFAPVFTSGSVLQRDQPIALWGTGRPGEPITVQLFIAPDAPLSATTTVNPDGRWFATLPPTPASPGTASTTLRLVGDTTVTLADIAIGEVWLGLGQSNMEWRLNQCGPFSADLLATADNPAIRHLKIPLRPNPADPLPPFAWKSFNRANAPLFSAVAYHFAAELHRRLGVPVGIVNCSYGGTPIEAWMSREALTAAGLQHALDTADRKLAAWPDSAAYDRAWTDYDTARRAWDDRKKANPSDPALGPQPVEPYGVRTKGRPAGLHASMLSLITPYTARGALWYHGENNVGRPAEYIRLLPAFLAELRSAWSRPEFPVFIAQLSSPSVLHPDDGDVYPVFRDIQRAAVLADAFSGLVVTLDRGERGNIHPPDKQPVGERFARLALARVHGLTGFSPQSPTAVSATLTSNHVAVAFTDLPGSLELRDSSVPTLEFQYSSGSWIPATAVVSPDGKQLLVDLPAGGPPTALRYAWRNFCPLTLFSDESLPVSPWLLPLK